MQDVQTGAGPRAAGRTKVLSPLVKELAPGFLALLASLPVALLMQLIYARWPGAPEKSVQVLVCALAAIGALPLAVYLLARRSRATLGKLCLLSLTAACVLLVAIYLFAVGSQLLFPADILIWSESDFVNDILKFRVGYPLYSAEVNNDSFTYVPGAQLITYLIASLAGHPTSVPAYRLIQLGYTLLAAIVALCCTRRLIETARQSEPVPHGPWWCALWLPVLFLLATNTVTNPFSHLLHNDALAQLVTISAYWLLLEYAASGSRRLLVLMALIPAAGFMVKQSLAIWAPLYCAYLFLFDRPRSLRLLLLFAAAAFGGVCASVAAGYYLWGGNFTYWVFTVLGKHGVSPLRSLQHLLDVWPFFAVGLIGGAVFLRGRNFSRLLGPWLIWLVLISLETYTSGVAWMLNHIGPGCLIAGVWLAASLARLSALDSSLKVGQAAGEHWLRAGVSVAGLCLLLHGLGAVRIPLPALERDAYRYIGEITREFTGQPADSVLLDMGTWVYLADGVVMKDRAPSIGERGYSATGDFSGVLERLRQKRYAKILVRNLHSPDFWYDHWLWGRSSGIRETMLDNYEEVRRVPGLAGPDPQAVPYGLRELSILVPRKN